MSTVQGAVRQSDWIAVGVWDCLSSGSVANWSAFVQRSGEKLRSYSHEVLTFSDVPKQGSTVSAHSFFWSAVFKISRFHWSVQLLFEEQAFADKSITLFARLWKVAFTFFFSLLSPHISLFHSLILSLSLWPSLSKQASRQSVQSSLLIASSHGWMESQLLPSALSMQHFSSYPLLPLLTALVYSLIWFQNSFKKKKRWGRD